MDTKEDHSYGVIPLYFDAGTWKVFLINQYGSTGDVYWTFPKGHPEGNESPKEAALRELNEETSIVLAELKETMTFKQDYTFICEGTCIKKHVLYYLGIAANTTFHIQEDEVQEAGWFSLSDARALLTYDHAKEMVTQIEGKLSELS